ncbi:MAG: hypothetical protein HKN07_02965 [Acidimicrobiia bacterium]|nr:hypothetical protein [Acidimicrobiia bacterium]
MNSILISLIVALLVSGCTSASGSATTSRSVSAITSTTAAVEPGASTTDASVTSLTTSVPVVDRSADLAYLVREIERLHPDPFWRTDRELFTAEVDRLTEAALDLSADEFAVEVMRLMTAFDGHSGVQAFQLGWDVAQLQLYLFEEGTFVTRSVDDALVGSEVVAVNDVPIPAAQAALAELVNYDNPRTIDLNIPLHLVMPRLLRAAGLIDGPATYTLTTPTGESVHLQPDVMPFDEYSEWLGHPSLGLPGADSPSYLSNRGFAFWWDHLGDADLVHLHYNQVSSNSQDPVDLTNTSLASVAEAIDATLDANSTARFVIDLRLNGGGNNQTYGPLLDLVTERYADRCGLYVIIGRNTFSAATNFATEVEQATSAVFVGEETGGSPNLFGDTRLVVLPESRIRVHVSQRYWEFAGPEDDRLWIEPDLEVRPTAADYFSGRDAALETIMAHTCA